MGSQICPPCIFSAKSCRGIFIPHISSPPPPPTPVKLDSYTESGSSYLWWNGSARTKPSFTEVLNISQSIKRLSTVKLSTANTSDGHASYFAWLPWPSPLKLASLPLASGASLSLTFYARPPLPPSSKLLHSQVHARSPW